MLAVAKIVKLEQEKKRLLQMNFRVKVKTSVTRLLFAANLGNH